MENSFSDYRDKTVAGSDSDSEFIDNSFMDESFVPKKTPGKNNQTAYVPESDSDSLTGGESEQENISKSISKAATRRSTITQQHLVLSSDDEQSKRGSIRRQSDSSIKLVLSSSDEEEQVSPEMIPKRRLPTKASRQSESSFIGRKTKKRIFLIDSDTDNSIIIERDKTRKMACLKETPAKIENGRRILDDIKNMSIQSNDGTEFSDDEHVDENDDDQKSEPDENPEKQNSDINENTDNDRSDTEYRGDDVNNSSRKNSVNTSDDGPDEDEMLMSRATRMSIMGVIPKDIDTDESDFIQSDDTNHTSRASSLANLTDPPDLAPTEIKSPEKDPEPADADTSNITCSPFASHLRDITNEINNSNKNHSNISNVSNPKLLSPEICDLTTDSNTPKKIQLSKLSGTSIEQVIDDDITIIDTKPEIIALSSDDEYEVKEEKKSPNIKKSPRPKEEKSKRIDNNIKQYLLPPSYPNQVVYVKKEVRENELSKLEGLREDLHNVRYLLENMDMDTLPDGGVKLIERLTTLEAEVRRQGDKVAGMVVEPDHPTPEQMANDGFNNEKEREKRGLSWDDIQKVSNQVLPRTNQAISTHMAERNLILDRLRDLYESLKSRPPENELATQPSAMKSELMEHQLHALAWLRWRETQKPPGGILADDMGLGKTITMISLIASDKELHVDDDDEDKPTGRIARGGTLVVCPASLMAQWAGEVGKHCRPHALSVCQHHGAARATQPHRLAASDLVLTTYHILQRESEKGGVLTKVAWRRVILDEAHAVRNHKAATSQAVCGLRARRRWALTGTPLHNKDLDLFALLKFLRCSPFDDLTMWKKWIDNKSMGGQERLSTIMRCIMLRRTKAQLQARGQLACLPQRTAHYCDVTLPQDEMNVYQKVLVFSKTLFAQFLHQRAEKQADSMGTIAPNKDSEYAKMHKKMIALQGAKPVKSHEILVLLLRLRQVCCHCGLIAAMLDAEDAPELAEDPGGQDLLAELNKLTLEDAKDRRKSGEKKEEEEEDNVPGEGTTAAEAIRSVLSPNNPVFNLQRRSAKIDAVMKCLNENVFPNKGEKAVVVSQWTSVLQLVQRELAVARVRSVTLCGAVPVPARAPLITALNDPKSDVRVMLLSLCAGGVGLNLCGANHLLLLDPHWNPQLEEQAQDRIYRVGQTRPVHIYRFMCVDTVEQTIRQLQRTKLDLAESVLTGGARAAASKLTIDELKMLFNMG